MALTPGTRLGVYEVSAKIGEGGEVYRVAGSSWRKGVRRPVPRTDESSAWTCK